MEQNEVDQRWAMLIAMLIGLSAITYYAVQALEHRTVDIFMQECDGSKHQMKRPKSPLG